MTASLPFHSKPSPLDLRQPSSALVITLDREPLALRSTRNRLRTAVRRGAAWPPAERPSSWPGSAARSLARWQVASPPSRHGCRAPRVPPPPQQHGSLSSGVVVPGCPDAHRALVALSASTCPASARPVSGVRCPRVRCPMSSVQCPVSMSGVRFERPLSASTLSAPVSSWSKWVRQAATRLGTRQLGNYLTRGSQSPD
jgi:hypothetical protein